MTDKNTLLIIDGYGFVFRAYHVQPPLTAPDGSPVGAVYGFTSMLMKILHDFKPTFAVIVFDSGDKNFRHQIYDQYKAHRPPIAEELITQLPIMRTAARSLNFSVIEKSGYEADDVIATIATKATEQQQNAVIISSDKDLLQLMSDHIKIYDPIKNKYISSNDVVEKFGVTPDRLREVMALIGDKSDNIPGIPGIGPKTAATLIQQFGSCAAMLNSTEQINNIKQRAVIEASKAKALISWQLVGLDHNVDIAIDSEKFKWSPPNVNQLSDFLVSYGFKSLYKRAEGLFQIKINDNKLVDVDTVVIQEIFTKEELVPILHSAEDTGFLSIYVIEYQNQPAALVLSIKSDKSYIISLYHGSKAENLFEPIADNDWFVPIIAPYLENKAIKKITVNIKLLYSLFTVINSYEDIELMQYVLSAGAVKQDIFETAKQHLKLTDIINDSAKIVTKFHDNYQQLINELRNNHILQLYNNIDLPLSKIIYQMERNGIKVDLSYLQQLSSEFATEISSLEQEIFNLSGVKFNISSTKQLGTVLFEKMQLPFSKISAKSKNYVTDVEVLEVLSEHGYVIADLLLRWRLLSKLKNTYTDGLQSHINPVNHRIHTTFLQTSTTTARLSSQNPNLQNIPIRSKEGNKIRTVFIAEPEHKLISADYSQIELRILSHVANVAKLKQAFMNGLDIHSLTACNIFKLNQSQLTSEHRRKAKAINFGIIYGISAFGLAKQLNITSKEATEYMHSYFAEYTEIQEYMENTKIYARKYGYVKNLFDRKCFIPSINDKNSNIRQFSERAAINAPIQGTSADIIRIAMININKEISRQRLQAKLILQIHDELLFEVPQHEVAIVLPTLKNIMEQASPLSVPTIVEVKAGDNWMEIH
ncbi:DNA polymerase I [Candidatus Trichorickettsia mobilis]|uniref:DNA polymerase I n=1 Tax=Candidatus Trichorickettsia mobilis TaxID=1346319 RepID=A0ABZ0URB0_9RICK|nr:DNA polymerase I [Candidatus Trichorickettsia mobilis]WPY00351.1 DNA polymerase I [Candidatus Trichorickettsia mobilis]